MRIPKYLLRVAGCAPRGLVLVAWHGWQWLLDRDDAGTHRLRLDAAERRDHKAYATASRIRKDRVRTRSLALAAGTALLVIVAAVTAAAYPPGLWLLGLAAIVGLAWAGRPRNTRLIDHAVISPAAERITEGIITRALARLGLAGIDKDLREGRDITFIAPGVGRDGPGWRAELDLPHGVTVPMVADRREQLASGLRRPLACVWPEPAPDAHAGRLILHILDQPMRDMRPVAWPLAPKGSADLFRPVPFGTDQRARPVAVTLMFSSMVIGAMPRMGKTMALRILGLAAALDPSAEVRAWELKGTGDLSCLEHVARSYGSGADDPTLTACLADVRQVAAELDTRAKTIRGLPRDICPENKVTPELAARRSLGLYPLVLIISECQEAFGHPQLGGEFDQLCTAIVKRGPALGVILLLDTQRPDAKSLPGGIRANIGIRFCLRVMDQVANDMVLPTSSYKTGIRATDFAASDKGIGWLYGASDHPQVIRTCYTDAVQADQVGRRARRLRETAGTLAGYCLGDAEAALPVVDLLADVLAVTGSDERIWSETIAARLAELRPEVYRGWDATTVGDALRIRGADVSQVWLDGANRRGVTRAALLAATVPAARSSSAASDRNGR